MFIALEGPEAAGKSTQARIITALLKEWYPKKEIVLTREPGGTEYAEQIRALIFSSKAAGASALTEFGLMMAARANHVDLVIRPALARGAVVITDRYIGSTFAYQVRAPECGVPYRLFQAFCDAIGVLPDITIILDVDPSVGAVRMAIPGRENNSFDERGIAFQEKLRSAYLEYEEMLRTAGAAVEVITTTSATVDEVTRQMLSIITPKL